MKAGLWWLWAALMVGAARAETLSVVFTPQDPQARARGRLIVLACTGEFSSVSRAGLLRAYAGRMLSRKVDLAAGQSVDIDLGELPAGYTHLGVTVDSNQNFMWRGMADAGEFSSRRVMVRNGADRSLRLDEQARAPQPVGDDWLQEHEVGGVRLLVGLPPGYEEGQQTYPVLYVIHGFNGDRWSYRRRYQQWQQWMRREPMILVSLDCYGEYGHHLILDSAGNGNRMQVLREQIVPHIDRHFRSNGRRVLFGHSSGGWTVVSLLRRCGDLFAGGCASAPDPLTLGPWWRGDADNLYVDRAGQERYFAPCLKLSMRRFVDCERESDSYGQFTGFLAPFSGRVESTGWLRFESPFNLESGELNPAVWRHWEDQDQLLWAREHPDQARSAWHGRLRLVVGDRDEFGLTPTTRAFSQELERLNIEHEYLEIEGAGHFNLEEVEDAGGRLWKALYQLATVEKQG